jgi:hypothetical protein
MGCGECRADRPYLKQHATAAETHRASLVVLRQRRVTDAGRGKVLTRLDYLLEAAAGRRRPLTEVVLGRRSLARLQHKLGLDQAPTRYRGLPIRILVGYASYVGVAGPLAPVRPDCPCAACRGGFEHEAVCPVHDGTCGRCGRPVAEAVTGCRAYAGVCICLRPVPTR